MSSDAPGGGGYAPLAWSKSARFTPDAATLTSTSPARRVGTSTWVSSSDCGSSASVCTMACMVAGIVASVVAFAVLVVTFFWAFFGVIEFHGRLMSLEAWQSGRMHWS